MIPVKKTKRQGMSFYVVKNHQLSIKCNNLKTLVYYKVGSKIYYLP